MNKIIEYTTSQGSHMYVETKDALYNEPTRGMMDPEKIFISAKQKLESSLKPLKDFCDDIINSTKEIISSPSEVTIEMGLKFSAQAGIVLTSVDSEANIKISLKWIKNNNSNT